MNKVVSDAVSRLSEAEALDSLFKPMGVDGVYARTHLYENVVDALQRYLSQLRPMEAEILRFPPVMSRRQLEKSGYLKSFPQLLGCVCALHGTEADIAATLGRAARGEDWTRDADSADLVLSPAACYPAYPLAAERGAVPGSGYVFDVAADCFRHEPSRNMDRFQSFRMREFVRIGSPEQIVEFREGWMESAKRIASSLGLPFAMDQASDPFFGRVGLLMAANQLEHALKFELLVPVRNEQAPTACMSFNYHRDHFGKTWDLVLADGTPAHTGCVAFGVDRLAVALFAIHGLDTANWPVATRDALWLTSV
jgi:seryl-tRNA synthetase